MTLVNIDPDNPNGGRPDPAELLRYGIRGVALVPRRGMADYVAYLQAAGLLVFARITEQSEGYVLEDCPADIYQLGNEPDLAGHPDTHSSQEYIAWWNLYYGTWFAPSEPLAGYPVIAAGLCSGDTGWWRKVRDLGGLQGCSGLAVHPYGKPAAEAYKLLSAYRALTPTLPVWVTEWHRPAHEIAEYLAVLRRTSWIAGDAFFCWHDYGGWKLGEHRARMLGAL